MQSTFTHSASPLLEHPHTVWQTPGGRPCCPAPSALRQLLCKARRASFRWRRAIAQVAASTGLLPPHESR